jgi:hypothetical protein
MPEDVESTFEDFDSTPQMVAACSSIPGILSSKLIGLLRFTEISPELGRRGPNRYLLSFSFRIGVQTTIKTNPKAG